MAELLHLWPHLLAWLAGPAVILIIGLAGIRRWKKPSLLLIASALTSGGFFYGSMYREDITGMLESFAGLSTQQSLEWTSLLFSLAGTVPIVLLLWAVFCDRDTEPEAGPRL